MKNTKLYFGKEKRYIIGTFGTILGVIIGVIIKKHSNKFLSSILKNSRKGMLFGSIMVKLIKIIKEKSIIKIRITKQEDIK